MAQINLLGSSDLGKKSGFPTTLLGRVLFVVLILVLVYYTYLFFSIRSKTSAIAEMEQRIAQAQSESLSNIDRKELLTRQQQLQNANDLIKTHVYWSYFLPELAKVTLQNSSYLDITTQNNGIVELTLVVPNYAEMDKVLQVFDLPQFNQQFSDVKIVSIGKSQQKDVIRNELKVQLKFNTDYIRNRLN